MAAWAGARRGAGLAQPPAASDRQLACNFLAALAGPMAQHEAAGLGDVTATRCLARACWLRWNNNGICCTDSSTPVHEFDAQGALASKLQKLCSCRVGRCPSHVAVLHAASQLRRRCPGRRQACRPQLVLRPQLRELCQDNVGQGVAPAGQQARETWSGWAALGSHILLVLRVGAKPLAARLL